MSAKITPFSDVLAWLKGVAPNAQLSSDSRAIQVGDVFFAFPIKGAGDGRMFIDSAIERGAAAIVLEADGYPTTSALSVPMIAVASLASHAGALASAWYGKPDQGMLSIAITGTNGKTSCSQWLASALSLVDDTCAVIGTMGVGNYAKGDVKSLVETGFTTPDAIQLQRRLAQLKQDGANSLAIEVSSIGLDQGRLNGMHFDVAVFTNLTRDHLDYHGTMAAYAAAKAQLFTWPGLKAAVINLDDPFSTSLQQQVRSTTTAPAVTILGYSVEDTHVDGVNVVRASHIRTNHNGTSFHVDTPYGSAQVRTQLIGRFNVSNVLAVLCVLLVRDVPLAKAIAAIEKLHAVPGRMQQLGSSGHAIVVIDYAHTPDALEKTLSTLSEVAKERQGALWCVFGCGGDRDPGKRPLMGKVAELAKHIVVTNDNPRTEDPAAIIEQIVGGMSVVPQVIADRASAILYAIKHAADKDVILLAGKGHENYQEVNGKKSPFSDAEHAALALATVATSQFKHIKRAN